MKTYTICLIGLQSRQAFVIGGGTVAARKVEGLLAAGIQVKVISPVLVPDLQSAVDAGEITYIKRVYQQGDLEGAYLAIAATDDTGTNQAVWSEAVQCGCLINVVDDPDHSNFILPAIVQRGEMSIAISTGGNSTLTEILAELRPELKASFPAGKPRLEAALRVVDSEIVSIIKNQGKDAAIIYARNQLHKKN